MGMYKHIRNLWRNPTQESRDLLLKRLIKWRSEPATIRIPKPTRLDRARSLGYKAKPGFVIVRQRVDRGGRRRPDIKGARRSKHARQRKIVGKSYQSVAEERAAKKFPNLTVLNSYWAAKDGLHYWFEIIMLDAEHQAIKKDKRLAWAASKKQTRRVFRGLTSSARKSRGLRHKGKGAEKVRPSLRANKRLAK
ncbi:MAG: 50S ribosomal protein L15e [bacterium]|nr:50S ribosomal protein L15e [bacterium]